MHCHKRHLVSENIAKMKIFCARKNIKAMSCFFFIEGQAWCSGESCLTESPGRGFEAASPQILRGGRLASVFPFPKPHSCGSLRHWVCPLMYYRAGCMRFLTSSKNRMHGELVLARVNIFLTSDSLSPTYLFNSSGP